MTEKNTDRPEAEFSRGRTMLTFYVELNAKCGLQGVKLA